MKLSWPAEFVPLALLQSNDLHGYDLHRRISDDSVLRTIWRLGRSELYFLLKKLERRGWITPRAVEIAHGPPRTMYSITSAGRRVLGEWLAAPVQSPRDLRAEFLAKVYLGRLLASPGTSGLVQAQSDMLGKRLARLQEGAQRSGFERHVHRLRLLQLRAALLWLAEFEADQEPRSAGGPGVPAQPGSLALAQPTLAVGASDLPAGARIHPGGDGTINR